MARRFARIAAAFLLALYVGWEVAADPPGVVILLALVAAWTLLIDFLIDMPGEVRALKARPDARPRKWPRIPWGLDPFSVLTAVAIGIATAWWVGSAVWIVMSALLWTGWIWTRQFTDSDDGLSPRARRAFAAVFYPLILGLAAIVIIQAASKWGNNGVLAAFAGFFVWGFLAERLDRGSEEEED
jgi:hypothetical protein